MREPKITVISTDQWGAYHDHNVMHDERPSRFKNCNHLEAILKDEVTASMYSGMIPTKVAVNYRQEDSEDFAIFSLMSSHGYNLTYEYMGILKG